MKHITKLVGSVISIFFIVITLFAVGPKIPHTLTFTQSATPGVTGNWFYWRIANTAYSDAQRYPVPASATNGFDLSVLGLSKGQYYIMMTATNSTTESDPSVEVMWITQIQISQVM